MRFIALDRNGARFFRLMCQAAVVVVVAGLFIAGRFMLGGQARLPIVTPPNGVDSSGSEQYLTHVTTDKPIYRTGEKLYVRAVVLRADGHTPMTGSQSPAGNAAFEIKGPKGETVASGFSAIIDSSIGFSWDIPAGQAGGEYTVRVTQSSGVAPAERKFDIRAYRAPRLKSQIVFGRDGYGPADTVTANLHVERAEGGLPVGARVSVSARVDGEETWKGVTTVDSAGNAGASFKLPVAIARGEGVIAMIIEDGGTVETATKTIPILLQTVDLAIYPEGGDLIAGLPNRIYLEARTPSKKPADLAGVLENSSGEEVAKFRTEHEGRGRLSFIPAKGEAYSIRVTEPSGIKALFPLPKLKASGVVISTVSDVSPRQKDVVVRVAASVDGNYGVALSQHGKELLFRTISLKAKRSSDVRLAVPKSLDGVLVATVYDESKTPMAERLLFRQPEHGLKVQVVANSVDYVPGDKVTLRVTTTDDIGRPLGAVVGLTVTDSSVLEMIEKREQAPRLPVMALLESDVKDLADAHVYLDETNPKAPLATDLLLGTQGWRRFATVDTDKFVTTYGDAGRRALALRMLPEFKRAQSQLSILEKEENLMFFLQKLAASRDGNIVIDGFPRTPARGGVVLPAAAPVPMFAEVRTVANAFVAGNLDAALLAGDFNLDLKDLRQGQQGQQGRQERAANFLTVREYAHALRPNWTEGSRIDFAETVYWNAGIRTSASTGTATVSFNLSDSVTSFRVLADGFAQDGALGSSVSHIESVQPFAIDPKMPLQITTGDVILLPVGIVNGLSRELRGIEVTPLGTTGIKFTMLGDNRPTLRPKERARQLIQLDLGREFTGVASLTLDGKAGSYRDSITRTLDIQPLGFPRETSTGGVLESNGSKSFEFILPSDFVPGSVSTSVTVYPTPLASMSDALQSLLREPNGCFEQTSSTSYPMVMAQQYFLTHSGIDPAIIEKTRGLLDISYKKLTGFETRTKGYEWFGADPGHEALTAYGLMQFTDMSQVRAVDKDMLDRTRAWLLSRRDGKGGFSLNAKALDSFGRAPVNTTNAYIVWALLESGEKGLDKEVAAVKASAASTQDSYIVALAANILHATGDKAGASQLMDKLAKNQEPAGNVKGAVTSITQSGGDGLAIETTALSVLAWMREPAYTAQVEKGIKWIAESNKSGRFGSTQSTILALRSIVAHDSANARPKAAGQLVLVVDGKPVGMPLAFTAGTQGALVLPEFGSDIGPGKHAVALKMENGSSMPYSISVKYHSVLPDSAEETKIGIRVALKDPQIQEGAVTEAMVSIVNKSDAVIPTPVAIVGIPGGLEVRHDQLKELVKSGKIDAYEVRGREVILYWRYVKANDTFDLTLSLVAAIPGSYTGPASRAYLYYTDEFKTWAAGLQVTISPR